MKRKMYLYPIFLFFLYALIACAAGNEPTTSDEVYSISYYVYNDVQPYQEAMLPYNVSITMMASGQGHTLALTSAGEVYTWGRNECGQLGNGQTLNAFTPINITGYFNLAAEESIVSVSAGAVSSMALTSMGRIFTWGQNAYGQLGNDSYTLSKIPQDITPQFDFDADDQPIQIEMGAYHTMVLTEKQLLYVFGYNLHGELGLGHTLNKNTPIRLDLAPLLNTGERVLMMSAEANHTLMTTTDQRVFGWGNNTSGQLGTGDTSQRLSPTLLSAGLGLDPDESVQKAVAGRNHSLFLTSNHRVLSVGANDTGQLGNMDIASRLTPVDITENFADETATIADIFCHYDSSFAITDTYEIYAWGYNDGSLGDGTIEPRLSPVKITDHFSIDEDDEPLWICGGVNFSYIYTGHRMLYVFGYGSQGQLGLGSFESNTTPEPLALCSLMLVMNVQQIHHGALICCYHPEERAGYVFSGWYTDEAMSIPFELSNQPMPDGDITLYGRWVLVDE